jgi:ribosomal protein S3AE
VAVKKIWYDIVAPEMFGSTVIGQTLAAEPKQLVGRVRKPEILY